MTTTVTLTLAPGIAQGIIPGVCRHLVAGVNATISLSDFEKISPNALRDFIEVVSVQSGPQLFHDSLSLSTNIPAADLSTLPLGIVPGAVEPGYGDNDRFMLVKVVDATCSAGDAVCWANVDEAEYVGEYTSGGTDHVLSPTITSTPVLQGVVGSGPSAPPAPAVTRVRTGGSALTPLKFAGIVQSAITQNNYGWIMIDGLSNVPTGVASVGAPLAVHPTTAGGLREFVTSETYTVSTGASAASGTFTLTVGNYQTAPLAYNATAASIQSALSALTSVGNGNVSVTGTSVNTTGGVTVVFGGALAEVDVDFSGLPTQNYAVIGEMPPITGIPGGEFVLSASGADSDYSVVGVSFTTLGVDIRGRSPRIVYLPRHAKTGRY